MLQATRGMDMRRGRLTRKTRKVHSMNDGTMIPQRACKARSCTKRRNRSSLSFPMTRYPKLVSQNSFPRTRVQSTAPVASQDPLATSPRHKSGAARAPGLPGTRCVKVHGRLYRKRTRVKSGRGRGRVGSRVKVGPVRARG